MKATPTIGRIVHYCVSEAAIDSPLMCYAAMIVFGFDAIPGKEGYVSLKIFHPDGTDGFEGSVPFSEKYKKGHWTWPPRVEVTAKFEIEEKEV